VKGLKPTLISLLAVGLLAGSAVGVAAQDEAEGTTTFSTNLTCDFTGESVLPLPPCELDEETGVVSVTFNNPADKTGTFEGVQVANGTIGLNTVDGSVTLDALIMFWGAVEGCGVGTVYFANTGSGFMDEAGVVTLEQSVYEAVPGGTLAVTATLDESGVLADNGDGSTTAPYSGTYSCETDDADGE